MKGKTQRENMSTSKIKNSIGIRLIIIAVLTLVLLIPSLLINNLIYERKNRRDSAQMEVSEKWGDVQILTGPILSIPYNFYIQDKDKNLQKTTRFIHFLPEQLEMEGNLKSEQRYRGIYEVVVYNSKLKVKGSFNYPNINGLGINESEINWEGATVSFGITDMKGIKDFIPVKWNDNEYQASPGVDSKDIIYSGISFRPPLDEKIKKHSFSFDLNLNGSKELLFSPMGKETTVKLESDWNNPSFLGSFLPVERSITENGFTANWKILNLNRNYPQRWIGSQYNVANSEFGINLRLKVDEYQKTTRTSKYAIMFISLTFLSFFIIELISHKVVHPVQYLLIGFSLLVFYTLLLSLSEYLIFEQAYIIAAAGVISLISLYTKSVLSSTKLTLFITGILVILYTYLFIILQLQDYALLMGSIGLFIILATVMYLTRKIDWFSIMNNNNQQQLQ